MKLAKLNVVMAAPKRARLEIYDDIGPSWAGMIDTKAVAAALKQIGDVDQLEVHINSRGGSAFEGLGIATLLRDHPAQKLGFVEGIAASAATLPLMVCNSVTIPANALLMIHDPAVFAFGGEGEMKAAINMLAAVKQAGIALYASKSGKTADELAAIMSAETWYTGEAAVKAGFADNTSSELPQAPSKTEAQQSYKEFLALPLLATPSLLQPTTELNTLSQQQAAPAHTPVVDQSATIPTMTQEAAAKIAADAAAKAIADERQRTATIMALCSQAKEAGIVSQVS
jgi:ATP-dependent protease ClpP protease subunit